MLFVALLSTKPGSTFQEGGARRLQWEHPEGMNVVAEYWLETDAPKVVSIMEADSVAPFGAIRMDWGDLFEIEAFPAVTGEQGMEMLSSKRCLSSKRRVGQLLLWWAGVVRSPGTSF